MIRILLPVEHVMNNKLNTPLQCIVKLCLFSQNVTAKLPKALKQDDRSLVNLGHWGNDEKQKNQHFFTLSPLRILTQK